MQGLPDERGHQRGWLRRHRRLLLRLHRCRQPDGRRRHLHRPFEHNEGHTQVKIQPSRTDVHWIRDWHEYPIHLLRIFLHAKVSRLLQVWKPSVSLFCIYSDVLCIFSTFYVKQVFPIIPIQQNSCQLLDYRCTIMGQDYSRCVVVFTICVESFAK